MLHQYLLKEVRMSDLKTVYDTAIQMVLLKLYLQWMKQI